MEAKTWQERRDSLALDHYEKYQKIDEKNQENGNVVIEKRFSSYCYGYDQGRADLMKDIEGLVEALKFYADWNRSTRDEPFPPIYYDSKGPYSAPGCKARETLKKFEEALK